MMAAIIGYHLHRVEVSAMIVACPAAQRVLRPMCPVLGIDAPRVPRLARKRRRKREAAPSVEGSQPKPAEAGVRGGKKKRLTRKKREAALWYSNSEGKPMRLLPQRLPRD